MIIGSRQNINCVFTPSAGGPKQRYTGYISRLGLDIGVTGGGNGVFRHAGLEQALTSSFTPESAAAVKIDADDLSSDLHGSAAYRAHLISVMAQRAVKACTT